MIYVKDKINAVSWCNSFIKRRDNKYLGLASFAINDDFLLNRLFTISVVARKAAFQKSEQRSESLNTKTGTYTS